MANPKTKNARILQLHEFLEGNRILLGMGLECTGCCYDAIILDASAASKLLAMKALELQEADSIHIYD